MRHERVRGVTRVEAIRNFRGLVWKAWGNLLACTIWEGKILGTSGRGLAMTK
jgi:hypothetical protein